MQCFHAKTIDFAKLRDRVVPVLSNPGSAPRLGCHACETFALCLSVRSPEKLPSDVLQMLF